MLADAKMRLTRMSKRRVLFLLSIPVLFLMTVLALNSLIGDVSSWLNSETGTREDRVRLRAVRHSTFLHQRDSVDELEERYDVQKLFMLGEIHSAADQQQRDDGERQHAFNELLSDRLSLHRAIPDVRHEGCKKKTYHYDLPKTSVIICFYNEAWSTLLRTVHSVLDRTPPHLLYEIVLVDDSSELSYLDNKLSEYLWQLNPQKIKLVRTRQREGLIRARMFGATVATGQVLVFLDSHCEVNVNWLEPLLAVVADNRRSVAIPLIDIINPGTFEYDPSPLVKGGFNWGLHFRWDQLPQEYFKDNSSYTENIETPTMAGGLFAIDRQYFRDMGEYDAQLETWGGENLEMSFRIWQCGGKLVLVPCSRVGHIFRKRRPYGSQYGGDTMTRNSVRVARVWMDDYIQYFFQIRPEASGVDYGNITDRLELRKKLNCKPFKWYLKYIYPEQVIPDEPNNKPGIPIQKFRPTYIRRGLIKHKASGQCIGSEQNVFTKKSALVLVPCQKGNKTQDWHETDKNELILSKLLCMDVDDSLNALVRLMKCHGSKGSQAWVWTIKNMVFQLYNPTSGKCMVPVKQDRHLYLTIEICGSNSQSAFTFEEK